MLFILLLLFRSVFRRRSWQSSSLVTDPIQFVIIAIAFGWKCKQRLKLYIVEVNETTARFHNLYHHHLLHIHSRRCCNGQKILFTSIIEFSDHRRLRNKEKPNIPARIAFMNKKTGAAAKRISSYLTQYRTRAAAYEENNDSVLFDKRAENWILSSVPPSVRVSIVVEKEEGS